MSVFEKSSKLNCFNYRPISLLSNVEKILENLCINESIIFCLKTILLITCNLVSDKKFSTFHTLINLTENTRQALDEAYTGCGIFVD